ncbi:hypothetical protein AB0G15_42390 [Streptosporangium sp. NPDC023825]|uniref:hypothetical protein n=1 Tax=Streptosporangium sp. NPDC023825 TaxID=3154909 RepID=UPI00342C2E4F
MEKLLEGAQIKLPSVISDIFGASSREMLTALIGGQRDPKVLAAMAHGPMRSKILLLQEALTGHFTDEHGFLCQMMTYRVDDLTTRIEAVSRRIEHKIAPHAAAVAQPDEIIGVGTMAASCGVVPGGERRNGGR